jgi:hypothetical protein
MERLRASDATLFIQGAVAVSWLRRLEADAIGRDLEQLRRRPTRGRTLAIVVTRVLCREFNKRARCANRGTHVLTSANSSRTPTNRCTFRAGVQVRIETRSAAFHEPRLFRLESLEFAFVEPHAFAVEALIDANTTESDLFELHSAFRTLHEVQRTLLLPFCSCSSAWRSSAAFRLRSASNRAKYSSSGSLGFTGYGSWHFRMVRSEPWRCVRSYDSVELNTQGSRRFGSQSDISRSPDNPGCPRKFPPRGCRLACRWHNDRAEPDRGDDATVQTFLMLADDKSFDHGPSAPCGSGSGDKIFLGRTRNERWGYLVKTAPDKNFLLGRSV